MASFSLDVSVGQANLSLRIQLGHPGDQHYDPGAQPHPLPPHDQQQDVVQQKRRHKDPKRREKDRARAAAHQTRLQSEAAAQAECETADQVSIQWKTPTTENETITSPLSSYNSFHIIIVVSNHYQEVVINYGTNL